MRTDLLTDAELRDLVAYREQWLGYGLSTEPADRGDAEGAIRAMYELLGATPPAFVWLDSPPACLFGWLFLCEGPGGQLWGQLRDQLWGQLGDQLRGQLQDQLGDQLRDQLRGQLWGQLQGQLWRALWGSHEGSWIAFYLFPQTRLDVVYDERALSTLRLWERIARSANWWWPHEGIVICCERPEIVSGWDERGRLHGASGPAIRFRDGYSLHAWHGVRVAQRVIEQPETLTGTEILDEANLEVRRAMLEIVGYERVLDVGTKIADDSFGELYRIPQEDDEDIWLVGVRDPSTERRYLLRCDPSAYGGLRSARAAVASTWRHSDGAFVFKRPEGYVLAAES